MSQAPKPRSSAAAPGSQIDIELPALCAQPEPKPVVLPASLAPARDFAIRIGAKKWVNGTVLHYYFLDRSGPGGWQWVDPQRDIVRWAAQEWMAVGIGLTLVEVQDATEAEILIGCLQDNRSWSLVGTDNLDPDLRLVGRTMNFGWDLTTSWGRATAQHELGHALGFSHEHQSTNAGIVWNAPAVYEYFMGPPNNWKKPDIDHNILTKLDPDEVQGSQWDPTSIMEYPFKPGLIASPKPYDTDGIPGNTVLSKLDKAWMKTWYPPLSQAKAISVMQVQALGAEAGQQRDFTFSPHATREYTVGTVGQSDCRLVVFEMRDGEPRHLASTDDSGADANAALKVKLVQGRDYIIRVRVNFVSAPAGAGLLVI
jgi:hypothetical protein